MFKEPGNANLAEFIWSLLSHFTGYSEENQKLCQYLPI